VADGFYLTSSRDEKITRSTFYPQEYKVGENILMFPKDEVAEGTWIAMGKSGTVACLLNGAFHNHEKKSTYSRSRGLILLESFAFSSSLEFIEKVDLTNVEPFTLLLLNPQKDSTDFTELRWDGNKKHSKIIDASKAQIWSSATLYNKEIQEKREFWFENWLNQNESEDDKNILSFHNRKHGFNSKEDIMAEFNDELKTLSVTQVRVSDKTVSMEYHDVIRDYIVQNSFIKENVRYAA